MSLDRILRRHAVPTVGVPERGDLVVALTSEGSPPSVFIPRGVSRSYSEA